MRELAETWVSWQIIGNALDLAVTDWKLAAMAGLIACMVRIAVKP
jgi:hypothetical protein